MLMEWAPISVAVRTSLATAKERWNSWLRVLPRRAGGLGGAHRVLHLAEDLGLAQHHRIEPAGHAEGMARRLVVGQGVGMRAQQGRCHAAAFGQPAHRVVERRMLGRAIDLGAVAGGDDGRLHLRVAAGAEGAAQAVQGGGQLIEGERKTTAQIERRGRVIQAQGPDCHGQDYKICRPKGPVPGPMAPKPAFFPMSPLDLIVHLANFAAPAFFLALLLALGGRLLLGNGARTALWAQFAITFIAGWRCWRAAWSTSAATG